MESPRRQFLKQSFAGVVLIGCGSRSRGLDLGPTGPAKLDPYVVASEATCSLTESNIEGPFFKANAPIVAPDEAGHEASLVQGQVEGVALEVRGRVLGGGCEPIANALIEVWHADHEGAYDHEGFDYRGRFHCDGDGRYRLRTIIPGHYRVGADHRPAHIHVKVHVPGRPVLTTQLYFAGDPYNEGDAFIRSSLVMDIRHAAGGARASFDFAV